MQLQASASACKALRRIAYEVLLYDTAASRNLGAGCVPCLTSLTSLPAAARLTQGALCASLKQGTAGGQARHAENAILTPFLCLPALQGPACSVGARRALAITYRGR